MKYLPDNTLAHFNAAPHVHLHDLSDLPCAVLSEATLKYREHCGTTFPNDEATSFYTLNHCAAIVRKLFSQNEPLPAWAAQILWTYTDITMAQGERLLHYILSICTREMRHLNSHANNADKFVKIETAGGPVMRAWIEHIQKLDEGAAVKHYMNQPPTATIGQYIKAMSAGFHKGGWGHAGHTSYGGPKWGLVADAASEMLTGETSMEMLVDHGYALAHNGGPIFNKGMMYTSHNDSLLTILDVQRSGQLPDLMLESNTLGINKTAHALEAVNLIKQHRPFDKNGEPFFKGYIDWKLVDALRPADDKKKHPGKYSKQTAAQKQPSKKVATTVAAPKPAAPVMVTIGGKKVKVTGTWQVFPYQSVKTYERVD